MDILYRVLFMTLIVVEELLAILLTFPYRVEETLLDSISETGLHVAVRLMVSLLSCSLNIRLLGK